MSRLQLWSCGGGRQSGGLAALISKGRIPPPDHACMVRLEWEVKTVWPYVESYIIPALRDKGVPFTVIDRRDYATVDMVGGADGESVLLPVYTDKSGAKSKLPEYCSGEWKREVVSRWAAEQPGWKSRGVDMWIGISWDESKRRRSARRQWLKPVYPLLDTYLRTVAECVRDCHDLGWPSPPRSRCHHCPNQSDSEWLELTPDEFDKACRTDEEMRLVDRDVYLHRTLIPLRQVKLDPGDNKQSGGCSSGTCY